MEKENMLTQIINVKIRWKKWTHVIRALVFVIVALFQKWENILMDGP
jgi:hypothetical protein